MLEIVRCTIENWGPTLGQAIIGLQSQWLVASGQEPGQDFLATCFEPTELHQKIEQGSIVYLASQAGRPVGFLMLCPNFVFEDQYKDGRGELQLDAPLPDATLSYLYQIVVAKDHLRKGLGRALWNRCAEENSRSLFCDIIVEPMINRSSIQFFESLGFRSIGALRLNHYREFGALVSKVFVSS